MLRSKKNTFNINIKDLFQMFHFKSVFFYFYLTGVVDSEDIPLNLSRELLQDSALIR